MSEPTNPAPFSPHAPGNRNLLSRSLQAVWHPCTQMKQHQYLPLVPIARGEGVWLYDFEGNRYLDAISSWWVNLFGHANSAINAALIAPAEVPERSAGPRAKRGSSRSRS